MAMSGVPVIVVGETRYRSKGFTLNPSNWDEYNNILDSILSHHPVESLRGEQVERAWNYAYRFFFDYPCPFPWHLLHFWDELENWPIKRVLSEEGQNIYAPTFQYLIGKPRKWDQPLQDKTHLPGIDGKLTAAV